MSQDEQGALPKENQTAIEESPAAVSAVSTALESAAISDVSSAPPVTVSSEPAGPPPATQQPSATQQAVTHADAAVATPNGSESTEQPATVSVSPSARPADSNVSTPEVAPAAHDDAANGAEPAQAAKPAPYAFSGVLACAIVQSYTTEHTLFVLQAGASAHLLD